MAIEWQRREYALKVAQKAAEQRQELRLQAQHALRGIAPRGNFSPQAMYRLQVWADRLWVSPTVASAAFVVSVVIREAGFFDLATVKYIAGWACLLSLVSAVAVALCSPFIYMVTVREIVGDWMMRAAIGIGLVAYLLWLHFWLCLLVLLVVFVGGITLACWGDAYQRRLKQLAR